MTEFNKRPSAEPYRLIIWGPGVVGGAALRAASTNDNFAIVGVKVFSPHKHGKDAGELVGIAPIGVKATRSKREILALDADCVLVTPQPRSVLEGLDTDVIDLLESGKSVISTARTTMLRCRIGSPGRDRPRRGSGKSRHTGRGVARLGALRAMGRPDVDELPRIRPDHRSSAAPVCRSTGACARDPARLLQACRMGHMLAAWNRSSPDIHGRAASDADVRGALACFAHRFRRGVRLFPGSREHVGGPSLFRFRSCSSGTWRPLDRRKGRRLLLR